MFINFCLIFGRSSSINGSRADTTIVDRRRNKTIIAFILIIIFKKKNKPNCESHYTPSAPRKRTLSLSLSVSLSMTHTDTRNAINKLYSVVM